MFKHQSDFSLLVRPLGGTYIHQPAEHNKNGDIWDVFTVNGGQHNTCIAVLPDHVWVVKLLQPFQQSHLSDCGHREAILVGLHSNALQSHKLPALCISGLVDRPISASSDLCHRLVLEHVSLPSFDNSVKNNTSPLHWLIMNDQALCGLHAKPPLVLQEVTVKANGRRQKQASTDGKPPVFPDTWCSSIALLCELNCH
ncbi:hypothetical protein EYF80_008367 [Liparis tanakae]|uniref:Uncharacterized protein n=1 Tax=Liparis tanakae TaxID=230148 RepID=A0A4Z2IU93_9TELE|nr:hypothetical protein EYF80_008367 [Liparis tanakae]